MPTTVEARDAPITDLVAVVAVKPLTISGCSATEVSSAPAALSANTAPRTQARTQPERDTVDITLRTANVGKNRIPTYFVNPPAPAISPAATVKPHIA